MLARVIPADAQSREASTRWALRPRRSLRVVAIAAIAAAIGGVGGYLLRDRAATVTVRVGHAISTPFQIAILTTGWTYAVPLDVTWRDIEGTWHLGSRPTCLPPTGEIGNVTFGAVDVRGGGGLSSRQVVWVDCGSTNGAP